MNLSPSPLKSISPAANAWVQAWPATLDTTPLDTTLLDKSKPARLRLFCFAYSGAGASIFRTWSHELAPDIDLYAIQLPGRERRLKEPLITDFRDLINQLLPALSPYLDRPFAFYGHSLGALIAFELARQLSPKQQQYCRHLFVASRQAPHQPGRQPNIYQLPDTALIAELKTLGGTPTAILEEPSLLHLFLPILRADLQLNETYIDIVKIDQNFKLAIPVTALGGDTDPKVSRTDLATWKSLTNQVFEIKIFPGDHFFLRSQQAALLALLRSRS
jgi:medium-chain acyl-[acyl-carrier-protein] hydrolase